MKLFKKIFPHFGYFDVPTWWWRCFLQHIVTFTKRILKKNWCSKIGRLKQSKKCLERWKTLNDLQTKLTFGTPNDFEVWRPFNECRKTVWTSKYFEAWGVLNVERLWTYFKQNWLLNVQWFLSLIFKFAFTWNCYF